MEVFEIKKKKKTTHILGPKTYGIAFKIGIY